MPSEAQARITINKLLEEAGWRFLPSNKLRRWGRTLSIGGIKNRLPSV